MKYSLLVLLVDFMKNCQRIVKYVLCVRYIHTITQGFIVWHNACMLYMSRRGSHIADLSIMQIQAV